MFGLSPLITLGIYAVIAVVLAWGVGTAITGIKDRIAAPYVAKQIEKNQKEIDASKAEVAVAQAKQAAAEQDARTAKGNNEACNSALGTQKAATKTMEDKAAANFAEARKQKAENDRMQAAMAPRIAELQAKAAAAPKLVTCETDLAEARKGLIEIIDRRRGTAK